MSTTEHLIWLAQLAFMLSPMVVLMGTVFAAIYAAETRKK